MRASDVALLGLVLALAGCEARERERALEVEVRELRTRIRAACAGAAGQVAGTLRVLETRPDVGMDLAAHDASYGHLCGGDYHSVGDAALRSDVAATRAALVKLRASWLAP